MSAPSPFKSKQLLNPMQMLTLMRDDPLLWREQELMVLIPDDFHQITRLHFVIRTNGNGGSERVD